MASSSLSKITIPTNENNLREDNVVLEIPLAALHPADFGASTSTATPIDNDENNLREDNVVLEIPLAALHPADFGASTSTATPIDNDENNLREDNVVLEIPLAALHPADFGASTSAATPIDNADRAQISDEEAACRICLDDLSAGGESLVLQCSCRGELALVHRVCAIEWFSRRGNNMCEVCHQIIQNLSLDLLTTISTADTTANQHAQVEANWGIVRVCQEVPAFVVANVFAYFFSLLYFLVDDMGDISLIVSLLLSCLLGYLSSATSTTMARGRYIWLYGVVQFSCAAISTYTFHFEVIFLKTRPLISVLFGSIVGFGVTFCCGSIVVGTLRIRRRWVQLNLQGANNS